jgi:hypothetical protein
MDEKIKQDSVYYESLLEDTYVDPKAKIDHPPVALSFGNSNGYPTPIGTYGNIVFVQAPPKSKKTFFMSLLSAVYLDGNNKFGGDILGHRGKRKLIHFDTEQGKFHAHRVFKRVLDMCSHEGEDYKTFALRPLSPTERCDFIEYYLGTQISKGEAGIVIIDGVADLVNDVNNIEESNIVTQKLMRWSAKYDCTIITVIHSNFGSDKPTGHLGSALEKKAETQILLESNSVHKEHITVKCRRSRNFPFENFEFYVNERGYPCMVGQAPDPFKEFRK